MIGVLDGDAVEVVDVQLHARLVGDGEQVQDRVGGAAAGGDAGDRVLDRLARDDVARALAAPQDVHHELAGAVGGVLLALVLGRDVGLAHRRDAHHLEGHRHRVGGELAAAGAEAGRRRLLHLAQLLVGDLARGVGADRLEDLHQRDLLAVQVTGGDRAAVEHHARQVQARERHHGAGDRLVAAGQRDHGVEHVALGDELDAVGDHLAGHQAGPHAGGAHRDAVGDRDGVELHRRAAGGADALLDLGAQRAQVVGARHRLDPGAGDADDRLGEGLGVVADPVQLGARGGAVRALGEGAGVVLEVHA